MPHGAESALRLRRCPRGLVAPARRRSRPTGLHGQVARPWQAPATAPGHLARRGSCLCPNRSDRPVHRPPVGTHSARRGAETGVLPSPSVRPVWARRGRVACQSPGLPAVPAWKLPRAHPAWQQVERLHRHRLPAGRLWPSQRLRPAYCRCGCFPRSPPSLPASVALFSWVSHAKRPAGLVREADVT